MEDMLFRYPAFDWIEEAQQPTFHAVNSCLVRKDHICGKILGASKSCFVACPSTEEVETSLALITEKLTKLGIEPVIAIKERAYGQDIFCTKICGKIIESKFCIVILDDVVQRLGGSDVNVPNPNVYYEYGLMTALDKHVIPLQKDGQNLAFNIQTHDTIKYTPRNLSSELDRAFKDALRITEEARSGINQTNRRSRRVFSRSLEINGYQRKRDNWVLSDDIEDTGFSGYSHQKQEGYVFFSVQNTKDTLLNCLTDMQVIIKRLAARCSDLEAQRKSSAEEVERLAAQMEMPLNLARVGSSVGVGSLRVSQERAIQKRDEAASRLALIKASKFAILLAPDLIALRDKVVDQYSKMDKETLPLPLHLGDFSSIQIDDITISFASPSL